MWKFTICVLGLLGLASAARVQEAMLHHTEPVATGGSLKSVVSLLKGRRDDEGAYVSIKFNVPPSEADDFEDEWERFADRVDDEEDVERFNLKKNVLDNFLYFSYGEFESMRDVREHFESKHFEKFSDFVDDHEIRWELKLLENLSEDIERKQEKDSKRRNHHRHDDDDDDDDDDKENDAHILTQYDVPPGEDDGFIDAWTESAYKTIEEDGNYRFALRKVVGDNTRFWVYGSWDSMEDWIDHFESRHVQRLHKYAADRKILYTRYVLGDIDNDEDDDDEDDDDCRRCAKKCNKKSTKKAPKKASKTATA